MHHTCDAVCGRPGVNRRCNRPAGYACREVSEYRFGALYYCERHKGHGASTENVTQPWNRRTAWSESET